jgi:hypothetical protein
MPPIRNDMSATIGAADIPLQVRQIGRKPKATHERQPAQQGRRRCAENAEHLPKLGEKRDAHLAKRNEEIERSCRAWLRLRRGPIVRIHGFHEHAMLLVAASDAQRRAAG